jgi:succinate-acetate transporter protein
MSATSRNAAVGADGTAQQWTKAGPVAGPLPPGEVLALQERQEVTVAEPAPLGLLGFATGTIAIGYVLSGFTPATASAQISTASVLLIFAGLTQFLAGMWAFRKGNTFAATAFGAYGANNMVVAVFFLMTAIGVFAKNFSTDVVLSIELFCFAYISLMLAAAAVRLNAVFVAVLGTLVPGFALSGLGLIGEPAVIGHIGGYFFILSALLAFYAGSALVINAVYGRTVLPLFGKA